MCLTTNDPTIRTATENMLVYKELKPDGLTPYRYFNYEDNIPALHVELTPEPWNIIDSKGDVFNYRGRTAFSQGYHSFVNKIDSCRKLRYAFIIPKGAQYVVGNFGDSDMDPDNYVSSTLIKVGKMGFWNFETRRKIREYLKQNKNVA